MYFVYILRSHKDESYYTGITENLGKRIKEHNDGSATYSSSRAPYLLVWYATFESSAKAYAFEKYLKSGSGVAFRNKHLI